MDADMVRVQVNFCDDSVKYQMHSIMVIPDVLPESRAVLQGGMVRNGVLPIGDGLWGQPVDGSPANARSISGAS